MIIESAFDVASFEVPLEQKLIFAWLCSERTAGVCKLGGGHISELVQEAVAAMGAWYGVPGGTLPLARLRSLHEDMLRQLHPDCDFGQFHVSRLNAFCAAAHALAAVISDGDQRAASHESNQSAESEVSIVTSAYYMKLGTYDGLNEHPSFVRQIEWQLNDLEILNSGSGAVIEELRARSIERGELLADEVQGNRLI